MMDIGLFTEMLMVDSTSGRERGLADFLAGRLLTGKNTLVRLDVDSMEADVPEGCGLPQNLLFAWGAPKVLFCTHLDTVPPYIPPSFDKEASMVRGRGTCDAKGQIFAMWEACKALESKGYDGFGLLLLAGEETGSFGAKAFNALMSGTRTAFSASSVISGPSVISGHPAVISSSSPVISSEVEISPDAWVIVGEPTDNCMAAAAKGTKSFEVTFKGEAFHSGYPEHGRSAVEMFGDFLNALRSIRFPYDEILGETTYNIGKLVSDNPQNILSPELTCRVYFRTTFESDEMVCNVMYNKFRNLLKKILYDLAAITRFNTRDKAPTLPEIDIRLSLSITTNRPAPGRVEA